MKNFTKIALIGAIAATSVLTAPQALAAPFPVTDGSGSISAPGRTQVSLTHSFTGFHAGTANEHEARPGLSIVKLYIADYVNKNGSDADKAQALEMLRSSNDNIASSLYAKYPDSINATARDYGLGSTHGAAHWGYSKTSSFDTVKFLEAKKRENPNDPVLIGMTTAYPVAADGYAQDYGTATIPGVIGTKWGWSDDRSSFHGSASIGNDFTIAANTNGTKWQHTEDVQAAVSVAPSIPLPPVNSTPGSSSSDIKGVVSYHRQELNNAIQTAPIDQSIKNEMVNFVNGQVNNINNSIPNF